MTVRLRNNLLACAVIAAGAFASPSGRQAAVANACYETENECTSANLSRCWPSQPICYDTTITCAPLWEWTGECWP